MSLSLRFKLLAAVVLVTSISLCFVGFTNYKLSKDKLISQLEEHAVSSVRQSAQNMYDFLSIRLAEVELISRVEVMKSGTLQDQLEYLSQELSTGGNRFYSMGIIDLQGNLTFTTGETLHIAGEKHFQAARTGKTFISDPLFSKRTKQYIISITVPVFNEHHEVVRIVDVALDATDTFDKHLIAPFEHGNCLIINRDGLMLYNSDPSLILSENIYTSNPGMKERLKSIVTKDSGFFNATFGGSEKRVFYTYVPNLDWFLAYTIPMKSFEAPAKSLLWTTIGLILITVFVLSYFIDWAAHSIVIKPIMQILRVTEAVAAGDLHMKPLRVTSKDELGALAHSVNGMIENLRELFEPFEAFIHHNQYAMIVMDPEFSILHFNARAEDMLGYKLTEVLKCQTPALWLDPDQLRERATRYSAELQEKIPEDCTALVIKSLREMPEDTEWIWRRKDGSRFYVESNVSIITHPDGSMKGFVCIARDVSDIKENTATKDRLLAIVENAHDIILTFDQHGYILYMNQVGRRYYGHQDAAESKRHFSDYVEMLSPIDFYEGLLISVKQGFWETEAEFLTKTNVRLVISLIIVPHITSDGSVHYYSAITRDITDQKRAQVELVRAKQEAEEANQAKSMFLARMSHEIRTPLNGIVGLTYLLERTELSGLQKDYVNKIAASSRSLSEIIRDILDFSKIEANKLVIEHIPFRLDEAVDRVCDTLSVLLGNKPIEFICKIDKHLPLHVVGDPLRLYQVLLNLTGNAIKFTDEGTISLQIDANQLSCDGCVQVGISVRDTGIGISEAELPHLFQPFTQADGSTSRKYGGTGLGLVITKNLIERMGGTINVSSSPGLGSEFRVSLPLELHEQQDDHFENRLFLGKALIVEDHAELRESLTGMLEACVSEAAGIASWEEAAKAASIIPLDAMLLDMEAPDMYGEESWLELHDQCRNNNIRTIVYTTLAGRDALTQLPEHVWPDAVIVKPVSPGALRRALTEVAASKYVSRPAEQTAGDSTEQSQPPLILVVEDNEINQTVAKTLLESRGYQVHLANNGTDALLCVQRNNYSLIVMDIHMPELDGLETTRRVRLLHEYAQTPIVALTAASTHQQRQACLQAGMNEMVTKPILPEQLFQVIEQCLQPEKLPQAAKASYPLAVPASVMDKVADILNVEQALQRVGGKMSIYTHMLQQFQKQYQDAAFQLHSLYQQQEWDRLLRELHTLRGTSGNISANRLFQAASWLEQSIRDQIESGTLDAARELNSVTEELSQVFDAIEGYLVR
ncbi:response regulator [Paenibacillus hexagrammi]|uniref:histidine kinase n=1 Tax=Paenibacillus hexagrammi TaxID=2908839 RepID=A0ABY3SMG1_9BACL|nr:response regulator [Paenibacillus sp. YPD9-1]UJF34605.1 response regulator [Paenibacillus sp. YPD9-1]